MAFRTGLHVSSLADRLCPPSAKSESWTYIYPNQREEDIRRALSEFCSSNVSFLPLNTKTNTTY